MAISGVPSDTDGSPQIVTPDEVVVNPRGGKHFKREIHDIIALNVKARRLVVGETFTAPGELVELPST